MNRLLLIDDDPKLRQSLAIGMRARGYACELAADASAAQRLLEEAGPFDLLLLDVTLPGQSGWDFLEAIRSTGDRTAVIFLTGSHEAADRVRGLRLGADDYVIKPFEFEELVARVEAVLRRQRPPVVYQLEDVRVDLTARQATRDGRDLELSQREFDLLAALIEAEGETLARSQLLEQVWDIRFDPGTNVVDVVVMRLRRKLDAGGGHAIHTVVGEGYRVRALRVNP